MEKIILVEPVLAHYQKDVWNNMRMSENFGFTIIAGKDYLGIKSLTDEKYKTFGYFRFGFLKHTFYFLKGACKYILNEKPDAIISFGIDFHHIHTILIFFIQRIILRKKFYWWSHGTYGHQGRFGVILRRFFYRRANGLFIYSQNGKNNMIKLGIRSERIQVVNNSLNRVEYGFLHYDLKNKPENKIFSILYCGRINEKKKLDILIRSLGIIFEKRLFDFRCVIVGRGDLDPLKRLCDSLNIAGKIEFAGAKYDEEIHPYFLSSDLFVYPSGIGLSIVQALSFNLPVITTDNISVHGPEIELLQLGINGDFFSDNSFIDLAEKIKKWYMRLKDGSNDNQKHYYQRIIDLGYLPEVVSSNVVGFLNREFSIPAN